MKTTIINVAPLLIAAAIGGAIVLAPVAGAVTQPVPSAPGPAAPTAPPPASYQTGVDPLIPGGGGADPYAPPYPGIDQSF
jgi:hypothetical protein